MDFISCILLFYSQTRADTGKTPISKTCYKKHQPTTRRSCRFIQCFYCWRALYMTCQCRRWLLRCVLRCGELVGLTAGSARHHWRLYQSSNRYQAVASGWVCYWVLLHLLAFIKVGCSTMKAFEIKLSKYRNATSYRLTTFFVAN